MAIGEGWVDGAWIDAGWITGAWVQAGAAKTIGGTSQLGAITSTGGLDVGRDIGATSQLGAITSTGGLTVQNLKTLGGTSQLGAITSSGTVQVGTTKGGATGTEYENWRSKEHKKRLKALQRDDEEVAALLLAEIIRRAA